MSRYIFDGTFKDGNGRVVGTATTSDGVAGTISVYEAGGTTAASVYAASSGGTAVNSVSTNTHGYFYFWVDDTDYAVTQRFKIVLSHSDFESKTYDNLRILNHLDSVTATVTELNIMDGITSTTAELNILHGVTATYTELNVMDDITATTAELNQYPLTVTMADISSASSVWVVAPHAGDIAKIYSVINGAITDANAAITVELAGTAVTDAGITIAHSGSAAGTVDSSTPTALNTVTAGQAIEILTNGGSTNTVIATFTILITR